MKIILTTLAAAMCCMMTTSALAEDVKVTSPNGQLEVNVSCDGGRLYYDATLDGQRMLEKSALGLKTSIGDLTRALPTAASSAVSPRTCRLTHSPSV